MAECVLTFVAGPGFEGAWEGVRSVAVEALWRLGADLESMEWLAPERAVDLPFGNLDPEQAETAVRAALREQSGDLPLDIVAQRRAGRRKRLLLADMESTVIANEMLDELAEILELGPKIAEVTARSMNGETDFAPALRERVALLRGKPAAALDEATRRIRVTSGARELIATMRGNGAFTALVSGGFRSFTGRVRAELGFDIDIANELVIEGGEIAGSVREPVLGPEAKLAALRMLAADRGLPLADTLAVGDGANDIGMLEAAGLGIAFHAKPVVRQRARHRIDHADLTALLYLQGYREEEIKR
ncbi:MAG TPA: phosphoserine phosphatase SerB [Stellaceae bacterium]|nr:phosphoserine phosphatase SerB [Stellaceae bacterium]